MVYYMRLSVNQNNGNTWIEDRLARAPLESWKSSRLARVPLGSWKWN